MARRVALILSLIATLMALLACGMQMPDATPTPPAPTPVTVTVQPPTPTLAPVPSPTPMPEIAIVSYRPALGIDYTHPEKYMEQGDQSHISDPTVLDPLRSDVQSMAHLGEIYRWLKQEFEAYRAGGKTIGVVTVDDLLVERRLGGCHDHGLVYAAVARELGYPAVMARTVSIAWAQRFQAGEQGPHVGHVFVEVYLADRWVLVDSTNGWYLEVGYDPADPVIPLKGQIAGSNDESYGFYVERKAIDTWAMGIHSPAESMEAMDAFGSQLDLEGIVYPDYTFQHFEK